MQNVLSLLVAGCILVGGCVTLKSGYRAVYPPVLRSPVIDLRDCKPVSPVEVLRRFEVVPRRLPEVIEERVA